jgi:3-hydroxyacyl-CoA dehydrogenase
VEGVASSIITTTDAQAAVKEADLVIEAIVENLEVKRKLFASLDAYATKHCIFATNTSSLSVSEVAESTSEARRAAYVAFHSGSKAPPLTLIGLGLGGYTSSTVSLLPYHSNEAHRF